jgi:hypothetical protein
VQGAAYREIGAKVVAARLYSYLHLLARPPPNHYTTGMATDANNPVVLAERLTDVEAALLVAHLETRGIVARTSGVGGATGWPEAAGYTQVVVRQADLERATTAVREFRDQRA